MKYKLDLNLKIERDNWKRYTRWREDWWLVSLKNKRREFHYTRARTFNVKVFNGSLLVPRSAVIVFLHFFKTVQGGTDFSSNLYLEDDYCGACAWRGGRWAEKSGRYRLLLRAYSQVCSGFFLLRILYFFISSSSQRVTGALIQTQCSVKRRGGGGPLVWTWLNENNEIYLKNNVTVEIEKNGENIDWQI